MGKKSPPPAPDYTGVAREQSVASSALVDKQTQQNRPDIYTPWGSQTWTQDPYNSDRWTMNLNLSPDQQKALNDQQAIQAGRSGGALQLLDQATKSFQTPVDYDGLPQGGQSIQAPNLGENAPAFSFGGGGPIQGGFDMGGPLQTSLGRQRALPADVRLNQITAQSVGGGGGSSSGPLKFQMDRTAGEWRQKGQDAALAFQQPLIDRRRSQLENQLANMGLTRGSEAWDAEMQRDSDQAMRDQLQAFGAGQSEANMLFNQDLQGSEFTNRARGQEFDQSFRNAQLGQQAMLANAQMALQASMANNDYALRRGDFQLRSAGQDFGQNLAAAQFGNSARGQDFGQNLAAAQFGNQAQQQDFNQNLARGQFYQNAVDQQDRRASTQFDQMLRAGGYNQNLRNAMLNEQLARRNQPLNELNALLTGQQVQNPNMPSFNTAGRGETPQLLDAANMGYQANMDQYNAGMGNLFNVAQMGMNAFMFSDARLKEDIKYTGASIGGIPVVHYRYRGLPGRRIGVIAQDVARVKPHAVVLDPSGFLKVNLLELCA